MKVYAHYLGKDTTEDGNSYRWRTLLQFGNTWKCIGSVYLKNPGSAIPLEPKSPIRDKQILQHLHQYSSEYDWFSFSGDSTMSHIESIFKIYYNKQSSREELNGVIQIFNLMNVMEPKLNDAIEKFKRAKCQLAQTTEKDLSQLVSPIYLGWSTLGENKIFKDKAERIFNKVLFDYDGRYLENNFSKNRFYHPLYMMVYGRNRRHCLKTLNAFCQNTTTPEYNVQSVYTNTISKQEIQEIYSKAVIRLKEEVFYQTKTIEEDSKKCRLELNSELMVTITIQENGYLAIRNKKNCNASKEYYIPILTKYGYSTSSPAWFGTKTFKEYGANKKSIVEEIINELSSIKEEFKLNQDL